MNAQQALAATQQDFAKRVARANVLLQQFKYADASAKFTDAINLLPTDPTVPTLRIQASYADAIARGQIAMTNKTYGIAVGTYQDALARPGDQAAQLNLQTAQNLLQGGTNPVINPIPPPAATSPTVTGISPVSGQTGTLVAVTGTGFTNASTVTFGNVRQPASRLAMPASSR